MSKPPATLHLIYGKIASGKSTLAAKLGQEPATIVISEDAWLATLFAGEMTTLNDYVRCMAKLREVMAPHIVSLLQSGLSVVLDFQANTVDSRNWMRRVFEQANAPHILHVLDVPDAVCLKRLETRNAQGDHPFTISAEQFHHISRHVVPPSPAEKFNTRVVDKTTV
ncbi:MAG: ATP-binding protein [Pseudomonadota bacterium]